MADTLEFDGKIYHSVKDATKHVSYSRDYVTRLAREKKIAAQNVGRQWFIDLDSLQDYSVLSETEQLVRKETLSQERKREREISEAARRQRNSLDKKVKTLHVRSVTAAALVLSLGLVSGWATYQMSQSSSISQAPSSQTTQTAQVNQYPPAPALPPRPDTDPISGIALPEVGAREVTSLGGERGILLFPSGEVLDDVTEMFSDEVKIREREDGTKVVVQVDAAGNIIGNEVPLVEVPVNVSNE